MSVAYQAERSGLAHGRAGGHRTGLLQLIGEAVRSLFVSPPQDEREAEQLGFAAPVAQACPFTDMRLIKAFRRGREQREEWAGTAW
jgi:hypothetical protein